MNYIFKEVDIKELDEFSFNSPKGHIFQSSYWAIFKTEWVHRAIVAYDNQNNITLSCIILIRKLPFINYKMAYIPRGFVCDYKNELLLKEFTEFLKQFSKDNKIAFVTMDPDIHLNEDTVKIQHSIDICSTLKTLGYVENSSKNFENIQPNFVFRLNIPEDSENIPTENIKINILKHFSSKARYNIKLGIERGLTIEKYTFDNLTDEKLNIFQNLMEITGKRDKFIVRKKDYFFDMIKTLNPYCKLYLVKYCYEVDKNNIYRKINKCKSNIDTAKLKLINLEDSLKNPTLDNEKILKINEKIKSRKNEISLNESQLDMLEKKLLIISNYKNKEVYLSGAIYLNWGKKAWYLYGASHNILRDTMPNFFMQYEMIKDSIDNSIRTYDFRGVSGDLNKTNPLYGLYKFKKMFNGTFVEFIGEYTLINNQNIYTLFRKIFPRFKEIRNSFLNKS